MNYEKLLRPHPVKTEILQSHNVAPGATVTLDGVIFNNGIISKIEFLELSYVKGAKTSIIKLYMGNLIVDSVVTSDDYVIESLVALLAVLLKIIRERQAMF